MPYTRPSRKGLPEQIKIPRSESYLHLSDLGETSGSGEDRSPQSQSASDVDLRQYVKPGRFGRMPDIPSETSKERTSRDSERSNIAQGMTVLVASPIVSERESEDEFGRGRDDFQSYLQRSERIVSPEVCF